jgi:hypothetical protein
MLYFTATWNVLLLLDIKGASVYSWIGTLHLKGIEKPKTPHSGIAKHSK